MNINGPLTDQTPSSSCSPSSAAPILPSPPFLQSSDIAQILVVYADREDRDRAEKECRPRKVGEPFLGYPSGLTPPSIGVTTRRYAKTRERLPLWK